MARVESLRPGEVLTSNFAETPLPELLVAILRANLSGVLELELGTGRVNLIAFRDGVPVAGSAPDLGVSLTSLLRARGAVGGGAADRAAREARRRGVTESVVVSLEGLVGEGVLREALRARAQAELVAAFARVGVPFRFREGAPIPAGAELAVLRPMPAIFAGLAAHPDHPTLVRFGARLGRHRFRLVDTYPRGVDPFEWGEVTERAVLALTQPEGIDELVDRGVPPARALAALASLHLFDMVEPVDPRVAHAPPSDAPEPAGAPTAGGWRAAQGLARAALAQRLGPLQGLDYFAVLRVPADAEPAELRGALRASARRVDALPRDAGRDGLEALLDEISALVEDPRALESYRAAVRARNLGGRAAFELEPKLARARRALSEGAFAVAEHWLDWAAGVAPRLPALRVYRELVALVGASTIDRAAVAAEADQAVAPLLAALAPDDPAQVARPLLVAARGQHEQARQALDALGQRTFHALVDRWARAEP
jgi:hypothetical protein